MDRFIVLDADLDEVGTHATLAAAVKAAREASGANSFGYDGTHYVAQILGVATKVPQDLPPYTAYSKKKK